MQSGPGNSQVPVDSEILSPREHWACNFCPKNAQQHDVSSLHYAGVIIFGVLVSACAVSWLDNNNRQLFETVLQQRFAKNSTCSPDKMELQFRGLAWVPRARCFNFFTELLFIQELYIKWVLVNCWGNLTKCWEVTCDGLASHPKGVAMWLHGM